MLNNTLSKHPSGIRPRGVSTYYLMKLSCLYGVARRVLSPSRAYRQAADIVMDTARNEIVQKKYIFLIFFLLAIEEISW